jgi:hypothetical protein
VSIEHSVVDQKLIRKYTSLPAGLLTIEQFCDLYNVKKTKCYELMNSGALIARTIGGSMTRIRPVDAEAWASNLEIWTPKNSGAVLPDT